MTNFIKSSGNIFKDLGYKNPEECLNKADLIIESSIILAKMLGLTVKKYDYLCRGIQSEFTLKELQNILKRLTKQSFF